MVDELLKFDVEDHYWYLDLVIQMISLMLAHLFRLFAASVRAHLNVRCHLDYNYSPHKDTHTHMCICHRLDIENHPYFSFGCNH